uniref:Protein kinase domain-containing protein n=1 Tax=Megaviridae environmental sample TaxID=1737588 RepID=A0A5J6VIP7_9VIRU|nr:MAG: protein of unknown function DUF285 [Megaviridae environmental sample]
MQFENKYLKYKKKYMNLKQQIGGINNGAIAQKNAEIIKDNEFINYIDKNTERKIGEGSYGVIYSNKDIDSDKIDHYLDNKIRTVKKRINTDITRWEKDMVEIEIMKKLDHPNIIKLLAYEVNLYEIILVLPKYDYNLDRFIDDNHPYNHEQINLLPQFALQMMYAVNYLHENNIIHRDIKPENFVIKEFANTANIVLIDFGLAMENHTNDTQAHYFSGTLRYASPNQLQTHIRDYERNLQAKDEATRKYFYTRNCDTWSVGLSIFTMIYNTYFLENTRYTGDKKHELHQRIKKYINTYDRGSRFNELFDIMNINRNKKHKLLIHKEPLYNDLFEYIFTYTLVNDRIIFQHDISNDSVIYQQEFINDRVIYQQEISNAIQIFKQSLKTYNILESTKTCCLKSNVEMSTGNYKYYLTTPTPEQLIQNKTPQNLFRYIDNDYNGTLSESELENIRMTNDDFKINNDSYSSNEIPFNSFITKFFSSDDVIVAPVPTETQIQFDNDMLRDAIQAYLNDDKKIRENALKTYGDISNWDTSKVTTMSSMFRGALNFNQPLNWNTSKVTNMSSMFMGAVAFNQPLNWNTSKVTNMSSMFMGAVEFNQPLNWNTSQVTNMSNMFMGAQTFNQPLNWNTSKVTNMNKILMNAWAFNQPLNWNISKVTKSSNMFLNSAFREWIPLDLDTVHEFDNKTLRDAVQVYFDNNQIALETYGNISNWDTSQVTNMSYLFEDKPDFNQHLNWDTSNVINMEGMFENATTFNQPLNWDTSNVINMSTLFNSATTFNQPLNWDTSNVINMQAMFIRAYAFNQPLNWDTSKVTNMEYMFAFTQEFNQSLNWDTSKVTNRDGIILNARKFNQSFSWDTLKTTDVDIK